MDLCREIVWNYVQDETQYLKIEEADRMYVFLARLNPKFDGVRSRILGQRPTPSLREFCSEIRLEEDRSCAMNNPITTTSAAALIAKSPSTDGDKNPLPVCEHWAIDHLTNSSDLFISYNPSAGNECIRIADGSFSPVTGKGHISPFDSLVLRDTLHNLKSGMTIGTVWHNRGLYFLFEDASSRDDHRIGFMSLNFSVSKNDFMLWHFRLEHPNFQYMKYLFPHLFRNVNISSLNCVVCIHAKQSRVSFRSQPYKPSSPFTLIHSDVCGPSLVTTSTGKLWFVTFIDDHTCLPGSSSSLTNLLVSDNGQEFFNTSFRESTLIHISSKPSSEYDDPVLPTNQVPWKTYYRKDLRKEVVSPVEPKLSALVYESIPPSDQTDECRQDKGEGSSNTERMAEEETIENEMILVNDDLEDTTEISDTKIADHGEEPGKLKDRDVSLDFLIALRKGTRSCTKYPMHSYLTYSNLVPEFKAFTTSLDTVMVPNDISVAMKKLEWRSAIMEEMRALEKNETWEQVTLPKGHKTVGCK
ncbi:uncharacterized protein LOC120079112 [Benincasa hispida]|uniref:uncharacterized protein LOC120079112 n=1 Tax=Benincasa hispida TaxID=102211 RepID=UPI00190062A7|nr:uncharacterized protein LOC120079112 [Benincasa hispida]